MRVCIQAQFRLFGEIKRRGKWYVAYCPPLDLSTQAKSFEEAKSNLIEASQLFLMSCLERGTLDRALKELGFVPLHVKKLQPCGSMPAGAFEFPVPIPFRFEKHVQCRA